MELIVAKTSSELGLKVKLSISNHDILEVFSTLNYTSSVPNINARIIHSSGDILSLNDWLKNRQIDTKSIRELNFISSRIEQLTPTEKAVFSFAINLEQPQSLRDIINLSYSLKNYKLYLETKSEQKTVQECILHHQGVYIYKNNFYTSNSYDGILLPDLNFGIKYIMRIKVTNPKAKIEMTLNLPANLTEIKRIQNILDIDNINKCRTLGCECLIDNIIPKINYKENIDYLNYFAISLKNLFTNEPNKLPILRLLLDNPKPNPIKKAIEIIKQLENDV